MVVLISWMSFASSPRCLAVALPRRGNIPFRLAPRGPGTGTPSGRARLPDHAESPTPVAGWRRGSRRAPRRARGGAGRTLRSGRDPRSPRPDPADLDPLAAGEARAA